MKIIIPMAGMGKRMRPQTLTIPKPLIEIAGKPIVQHLIEQLSSMVTEPLEEIAFIVGRFGKETEDKLVSIAEQLGAKGKIYYQDQALGTAHALYCAKDSIDGNVIVAFADTLFFADFKMDTQFDGVIWVKEVEDPSQFGVVKLDDNNKVTEFIEKPKTPVSNKAIIGIYYFSNGQLLKKEIEKIVEEDIRGNNEYQLTDALEFLKNKNYRFGVGKVDEWLDCGNVKATVYANQRMIEHFAAKNKLPKNSIKNINSVVIEPSYIGENVSLTNSVVGPYACIDDNAVISDSIIHGGVVKKNAVVQNICLESAFIGSFAHVSGRKRYLDISDYSISED